MRRSPKPIQPSSSIRVSLSVFLALAFAHPGTAQDTISLDRATTMARAALAHARSSGLRPMSVVILDADGGIRMAVREPGVSIGAFELTVAKAQTAYDYRLPTKALGTAFSSDAAALVAMATARQGRFMIIAGGRPFFDANGRFLGAAAAGGDKPDNDDATIASAIESVGFKADSPRQATPPPWK